MLYKNLLYVSETYILRESDSSRITIFEKKILRRIYVPIKEIMSDELDIIENYTKYVDLQT